MGTVQRVMVLSSFVALGACGDDPAISGQTPPWGTSNVDAGSQSEPSADAGSVTQDGDPTPGPEVDAGAVAPSDGSLPSADDAGSIADDGRSLTDLLGNGNLIDLLRRDGGIGLDDLSLLDLLRRDGGLVFSNLGNGQIDLPSGSAP
jgi:hypothetical protein